jgi:hypothetical protein
MRCGTTSLYRYLIAHPLVGAPRRKEISFFDRHYDRGLSWYRRYFPGAVARAYAQARHGGRLLTGEGTPTYLFHPHVPARAAEALPSARIVVLLRDPVERAYSHYHHELRRGYETLSFEEALAHERERIGAEAERVLRDPSYESDAFGHFSYLARGRYAEQLERWFACFPREQVLVLRSEDLFTATAETYSSVLEFLALPPYSPVSFPAPRRKKQRVEMSAKARRYLVDRLEEPNEQLYALLGRDLGWQR